jgi:probable rRNA maturation factor
MVTIQVKRNVKLQLDRSILLQAAQIAIKLTGTPGNSDMGIVIGNDALLSTLNQKYRNVESPTDVLSFPSGEIDPDTSDLYLGDIIISLPRAQEQAANEGHPLVDELQLLVVHGALHLLGYDHDDNDNKKRMQSAQDKILSQLGVKVINML